MSRVFYSNDPHADFDRYDAEQARQEERLPRCCECDEPIYEWCYEINDELVCEDCMLEHKKSIEHFI